MPREFPLATTAELTLEALVVSSQRMSGAFLPSFEAGQKKVGTAVPKHLRYIMYLKIKEKAKRKDNAIAVEFYLSF